MIGSFAVGGGEREFAKLVQGNPFTFEFGQARLAVGLDYIDLESVAVAGDGVVDGAERLQRCLAKREAGLGQVGPRWGGGPIFGRNYQIFSKLFQHPRRRVRAENPAPKHPPPGAKKKCKHFWFVTRACGAERKEGHSPKMMLRISKVS